MGAAHLGYRPSYRFADLLWSTEPPLSSAATSSTPLVLSGPQSPVVKPCASRLVNSNSSIVGRSRSSLSVSSFFALSLDVIAGAC